MSAASCAELLSLPVGCTQVSVYDANVLLRNELIGCYQFDVATVYLNADHEYYRQVSRGDETTCFFAVASVKRR